MAMHVSIEGYDSLEQIGVGGMAAVYKARKVSIDKVVAIKVLFPYLAGDTSFIERFQREAKAAARIQHENIVNVIDFGDSDGSYFIVMEYYEGQTLEDILKTQRALPVDIAVLVLLEVCYGLDSAHSQSIVHRDIKPGNIIYTNQGGIKIADFGLAKKSDSATLITQHGKVIGTPAYMSPEQAAGRNVGHQSDIFSLGVVAYDLFCQQKPFEGASYSEVLEKIQTHQPLAIGHFNPLVQPDFDRIVSRMLEKNVADRYQSITEVIADIEKSMEKFRITRDRRRLSSFIKDPEAYEKVFKEKTVARCLSQGAFFMQQGRSHLDEAILEFKRILFVDPSNDRAKKNLDKIMSDRGKDRTQAIDAVHPRAVAEKENGKAAKTRKGKKQHGSNRVVAASVRRRRGRVARRFVGGITALAAIVAAGYFGFTKGLPDLGFLKMEGNTPPVLSVPKRLSVNAGERIEFSLQSVDADGDSVGFYGDELPQGATLSPLGDFVWDVKYGQTGSHKIVFYADDGSSTSSSETIVDVQQASLVIDFKRIGTVRLEAGQTLKRKLQASSSSGESVDFSLVQGPKGMRISKGALVWKTGPEQSGAFKAIVKASDGYTSETQTVAVRVQSPSRDVAQKATTGRIEWTLPETANIYVDGSLREKESRGLSVDLPSGKHTLKAELMDGMTGWLETVDLKSGETVRLEAAEIAYGKLSVYFLGGVGELRIDGEPFKEQPPFTAVSIPAGLHVISCRMANDSEAPEFEITIKEDQETVIEYESGQDPIITNAQP